MAVASNSLIDVEYYRTQFAVDFDDENLKEDLVAQMIDQASRILMTECHRVFIPSSEVAEIFDGTDSREYYTKQSPITAISEVAQWDGTSFDAMSIDTYAYAFTSEQRTSRVYFTEGVKFVRGQDNYQVTYTYGWTRTTLPADLKAACAVLTAWLLRQQDKLGVASVSIGGGSTTSYNFKEYPIAIQGAIRDYRVSNYG